MYHLGWGRTNPQQGEEIQKILKIVFVDSFSISVRLTYILLRYFQNISNNFLKDYQFENNLVI